jgi:hypothetical protein
LERAVVGEVSHSLSDCFSFRFGKVSVIFPVNLALIYELS